MNYNDLRSTATENEKNNFAPGKSGKYTSETNTFIILIILIVAIVLLLNFIILRITKLRVEKLRKEKELLDYQIENIKNKEQ